VRRAYSFGHCPGAWGKPGGKRSKEVFDTVVATVNGKRNNENKRCRDLVDGGHGAKEERLPPTSRATRWSEASPNFFGETSLDGGGGGN
jgi:hypothetical protein